MWAYFLLGVALLVIGVLLGRWFASSSPTTLARVLRWGLIGIGSALALVLAVTGKIHLSFIPLSLTVLPALLGRMMAASRRMSAAQPSPGRTSDVETQYLRMTLNHDTGEMVGEVLKGPYAGKSLGDLSLTELEELLAECRQDDAQAAQLLEAYLDRAHGAERGRQAGAQQAGAQRADSGGARRSAYTGTMAAEEAREILGLGSDATTEEIKEAHHRLMKKLHPDQGGSTYFASQLNRAKEVLLKS